MSRPWAEGGTSGLEPEVVPRPSLWSAARAPRRTRLGRPGSKSLLRHSSICRQRQLPRRDQHTGNAADDNGCQLFRAAIGLHVSYQSSQLKYAESYVADNRDIKFVSLMIGANDLFLLQDYCTTHAAQNVNGCIIAGLPGLLHTLGTNLKTFYSGLRASGYMCPFVAVTYYSTDYRDPIVTGAVAAVDAVLAGVTRAYGGKVADGFGRFYRATASSWGNTCAAGLLIHLTPRSCDVHPSPAGSALLASALFATVSPDRPTTEHRTVSQRW